MLVSSLVLGPASLRAANSPSGVFPPTTNQPPTGLQILTGWNPSPDATVVGYYLCWGLASGQCTNLIDVGNVTNAMLSGLATNVLYYFTVVAHDALDQRAPPSNEIQFIGTNTPTLTPPLLVADLTNQSAALGSTVELAVVATGDVPLNYRWFFNGLPLTTPSSNVLDIAGLTVQQGGQYQVIITNSAGSVTSSIATLTVLLPPRIDADLISQTVCAGSNATFQVAVSGTGPFSYQWLCNDTNLSGAQGNYVTFNNVSQKQSGTYQVIVSNAVGVAASSPASLIVLNPPTILLDLTNQNVAVGSNVTFQVKVGGSSPLNYHWRFNGADLSGATSDSLALNNVSPAKAGTYQMIASNAVGMATSATAHLIVLSPPIITANPTNSVVAPGASATFQATVTGSGPLTYQWIFNETNLSGAITNPLVLSNVSSAEVGNYQLLVSNAVGIATSGVASLAILARPNITSDPVSEMVAAGSDVTFQAEVAGTGPLSYQWLFNGGVIPGASSNPLLLHSVTTASAGSYQLTVSNAAGAIVSGAATLTVGAPPLIVEDLTNQVATIGSDIIFAVAASGTGPLNYQWVFNGTNVVSTDSGELILTNISSAQAGTYYATVSNTYGSATSSVASLSFSAAPTILVNLTNQTVAVGSSVTLGVLAGGSGPLSYQWFFNGEVLPTASGATLTLSNITSAQAGMYQVMITNAVSSVTSDPAVVTVLNPPIIVVDLTNRTVLSGSNLVFQVQASGAGPLSYQWLYNGAAIPGATSNVLTLASVTSSQTGSYQVIVQNASGNAESALVSLQVIDPTPLKIHPVNGSVFKLSFRGAPGKTFTVQYSADLNSWVNSGATTADDTGIVVYLANQGGPNTFYRVVPK